MRLVRRQYQMSKLDPIVHRELPVIEKIIADETWLEGERRGRYVSSEDPVVRDKVCDVVLTIGGQLRESVQAQCGTETAPTPANDQNRAA
jgi:hypothetical protein